MIDTINPDLHHSEAKVLDDLEDGVCVARRGWLTRADVANTGPLDTVSRRIAEFRSRVS